jgi:1-deoxy-D-xylulose-5-phosphate reductoisomerase
MSKKKLAILGSTGSIGSQALEVISEHPDKFEVSVLTAHNNADLLIEQALKFKPNVVVISNEIHYKKVEERIWKEEIKTYAGSQALEEVVQMEEVDMVLSAIVGFAGLKPTIRAIESGKNIALANKEVLVIAGAIITGIAKEKGVNIYPVDSEHSAIFQCLVGEFHNPVEKVILTASGGPFFGFTQDELKKVTKAQALKHPVWKMGDKVTIDSATMMNKGFEVIEAKWLFGLKPEQIEVIIHPESVIHSMVQFKDGALKAQMGLPSMKQPIQYAFSYPERLEIKSNHFDFANFPSLTFEKPEKYSFLNLELAFKSLEKGGNIPAALNAANEIGVALFLDEKIPLNEISNLNKHVCDTIDFIPKPSLEELLLTDEKARLIATQ